MAGGPYFMGVTRGKIVGENALIMSLIVLIVRAIHKTAEIASNSGKAMERLAGESSRQSRSWDDHPQNKRNPERFPDS